MRKITIVMILVLLVGVVLIGCGNSTPTFTTFAPEDGSFSIDFPGEAVADSQSIDTPSGVMKIDTFMLEEEDQIYSAARNTLPQETLDQEREAVLINACNGAIAQTGGLNSEIEDTTIDGVAGKYLTYEIDTDGQILEAHQKIVIIDNEMYQLMVMTTDDEKYQEIRETFFNSFKVTK